MKRPAAEFTFKWTKMSIEMEVVQAAWVNDSNLKGLMLRLNNYIQEVFFYVSEHSNFDGNIT
jgi:hypothetical protein